MSHHLHQKLYRVNKTSIYNLVARVPFKSVLEKVVRTTNMITTCKTIPIDDACDFTGLPQTIAEILP
jgi:hypothetical protein